MKNVTKWFKVKDMLIEERSRVMSLKNTNQRKGKPKGYIGNESFMKFECIEEIVAAFFYSS